MPPLMTTHSDTLYAAALAGLGIAGLPSFIAEDALMEHALERVLPHWHMRRHAVRRDAHAQARADAHARIRRLPGGHLRPPNRATPGSRAAGCESC